MEKHSSLSENPLKEQLQAESTQKKLAIGNAVINFLALNDFLGTNLKALSGVQIYPLHRESYPTEELAGFFNGTNSSTQSGLDKTTIQDGIITAIEHAGQFADNTDFRFLFDQNFLGVNMYAIFDIDLKIIESFHKELMSDYLLYLVSVEQKTEDNTGKEASKELKEKVLHKLEVLITEDIVRDNNLLICLFQLHERGDKDFLENFLTPQKITELNPLFTREMQNYKFTPKFRNYIQNKVITVSRK